MATLFRLTVSFLVACVLVFAATGLIVLATDDEEPESPALTEVVSGTGVDVLSPEQTRHLLRREKGRLETPEPPRAPPPPPLRNINGFVQLEFTVNPDGSVSDVRVVGAVPEGHYEEQAKAIVRGRRYTPEYVEGEPVPRRETEVIEFTVPARAPAPEADGERTGG